MGIADSLKNKAVQYADQKVVDGYIASSGSALVGKVSQLKTSFADRVYKEGKQSKVPLSGPFSVGESKAQQVGDRFRKIIEKPKFDATSLPKKLRKKYPNVELLKYVTTPGYRRGGVDGYGDIGDEDYIIDVFKKIPELDNLLDNIGPRVEEFYSSPVRLLTTSIRRTGHVPEEIVKGSEVYSNYWHVDGHPVSHVRVLVALGDIDENDGPFHYLGYEDSRNVLEESFDRSKVGVPGSVVEGKYEVKKFTGSPGECLICNTNVVLHRAGNPAPKRSRDLMLLTFAPVRSRPNMSWREQSTYGLVRGTEGFWERLKW